MAFKQVFQTGDRFGVIRDKPVVCIVFTAAVT